MNTIEHDISNTPSHSPSTAQPSGAPENRGVEISNHILTKEIDLHEPAPVAENGPIESSPVENLSSSQDSSGYATLFSSEILVNEVVCNC